MSEEAQTFSDAAYAGNIDLLREMLGRGFDINAKDQDGFSALHRSCVTGKPEVIEFLVKNGADVNAEDSYGDSPMHYACFCGHQDAVQLLIDSGADPTKPSRDGKTPLESAKEEGHEAVVQLLQKGNSKVAGLDFSQGVIIEGELRKKRANRVVKWRRKYYVLSKTYGAMFFWTGSRSHVDGVIKKVRFETFLSVRHFKNQKGGRRFDIRVVTGRTMELLAASQSDAIHWVSTIKMHLGEIMAVIRVQTAFRTFKARKQLRLLIDQRQKAVKRLMARRRQSILTTSSGFGVNAGILMEGPLKKKNTESLSRLLSKFRTRYFVLSATDGALHYYENKTKRKLNVNPRSVPFLSLYSVIHLRDKKGKQTKRFLLRVVSGRVFEFEGKTMADTLKWVQKLLSVLPRDNVAAVKIQAAYRGKLARKSYQAMRAEATGKRAELEQAYGASYDTMMAAVKNLQRITRGHKARKQVRSRREARLQAEAAAKRAAKKLKRPIYLKKKHPAKPAGSAHSPDDAPTATDSRMARLKALRAKKAAAAAAAEHEVEAESAPDSAAVPAKAAVPAPKPPAAPKVMEKSAAEVVQATTAAGVVAETAEVTEVAAAAAEAEAEAEAEEEDVAKHWTKMVDPDSGNPYWHNPVTGDTTWDKPEGVEDEEAADAGKAEEESAAKAWIAVVDEDSGDTYYVNTVTQESSWEMPEGFSGADANPNHPWTRVTDDESGDVYYVNLDTQESSWEPPEGWVEPDAAAADAEAEAGAAEESSELGKTWNGWMAVYDEDSGDTYYVNEETQESAWEPPEGWPHGDDDDDDDEDVAEGEEWLELTDPSTGKVYYFNQKTEERRWTNPNKADHEDVASDVESDDEDSADDEADSDNEVDPSEAWLEMVDPSTNEAYFFNSVTQETTWDRPLAMRRSVPGYKVNAADLRLYTVFINSLLEGDDRCSAWLPLDPTAQHPGGVFDAVRNGVLLARLINKLSADTIDDRVVSWDAVPNPMPGSGAGAGAAADEGEGEGESKRSSARDNLNLCLQAAQTLGVVLGDVTSTALEEGDPKTVMTTLWQLLKVHVLSGLSLKTLHELVVLKREEDYLSDLLSLPPEQWLLRWINFQLQNADSSLVVAQLGMELADGVAYAVVLRHIAPDAAAGLPESEAEMKEMGKSALLPLVVQAMTDAGLPDMFTVEGLSSLDSRQHLAAVGMLFKALPSLVVEDSEEEDEAEEAEAAATEAAAAEEVESKATEPAADATAEAAAATPAATATAVAATPAVEKTTKKKKRVVHKAALSKEQLAALNEELQDIMEEEDTSSSRELRTMALWINSLGIKGVYVNDVVQDVKTGVLMLKVLDQIEPGIVNWKKAHLKPSNKYRCLENASLGVELGKAMDFSLVGVGAIDFIEGSPKMILAFVWQLMRYHTLKLLSSLAFDGFEADESDILQWANTTVREAGNDLRIRNFKDSKLRSGEFLLRLLHAVRPIVNWDLVQQGSSEEDYASNAKYVVSIARAMGATVFLSWEDIVEVKPKMIMMLVASIMKSTSSDKEAADDDFDQDDFGDEFDEDDEF